MLVIDYSSYAAIETRKVEIRISYVWVFHTSDLKRPKAVQITEIKQL